MELVNPNLDDEARLRSRVAAAIVAGGGVAQLARITGIPKGTLEKYAAQTSTPSFSNAAKIATGLGVTLDQIAYSNRDASTFGGIDAREIATDDASGDEFAASKSRDDFAGVPSVIPSFAHAKDRKMVPLPFFNEVKASAGLGLAAPEFPSESMVAFDHRFLKEKGAVPEKCTVITARGDSMTPTIPDGSLLVVDHSQTQIANGCIMVINLGDDLLVKRVRRRLDGLIDLVSDNAAYPAETIGRDMLQQLRVVGRVVYFCRTP